MALDKALEADENENPSSLFGRMIGKELEKLNPYQQHIARREIEDVVFRNKFGNSSMPLQPTTNSQDINNSHDVNDLYNIAK